MATEEEITEVMERLLEDCKKVLDYSATERMSMRMIKDEVTHAREQLSKVQQEIKELELRKSDIVLECEEVKNSAQRQADEIIKIARENLAFASRDREEAKKLLDDAKSTRFLAEKELERVSA